MSNYTPLDISLLLRARRQSLKQKGTGFDHVFFPFSIVVLIMSLSFYAVRPIIDITAPIQTTVPEPTQAPQKTVQEFSKTIVPSVSVPQIYHDVNGVLVDADKILQSAKTSYPDLSMVELVEQINKSVIQWAALRAYYKDNPNIVDRLSIKTAQPIATYSSVLKDVGLLISEYDKDKTEGKQTLDAVIQSFTTNSQIR